MVGIVVWIIEHIILGCAWIGVFLLKYPIIWAITHPIKSIALIVIIGVIKGLMS